MCFTVMFNTLFEGLEFGVSRVAVEVSITGVYLITDCRITWGLNEGYKLVWVELRLWIFQEYGAFEVISISVILFYWGPTRQALYARFRRAALAAYSCGPWDDLFSLLRQIAELRKFPTFPVESLPINQKAIQSECRIRKVDSRLNPVLLSLPS